MKLLGAAVALALLASPAISIGAGVDNSISPLCRADHAGTGYQRPGGFCDAVAAEAFGSDGTLHAPGAGPTVCLVGEEPNPTPPPDCVPV